MKCQQCGEPIPDSKRSDAIYCSERCRNTAKKFRWVARVRRDRPEYYEKLKKDMNEYGKRRHR